MSDGKQCWYDTDPYSGAVVGGAGDGTDDQPVYYSAEDWAATGRAVLAALCQAGVEFQTPAAS